MASPRAHTHTSLVLGHVPHPAGMLRQSGLALPVAALAQVQVLDAVVRGYAAQVGHTEPRGHRTGVAGSPHHLGHVEVSPAA